MTKSHDALTSGPPVHPLCFFTRLSYRHCPVASLRPGRPPGNVTLLMRLESRCYGRCFLRALGAALPCSPNFILFWPSNSSYSDCFISSLLRPSYASLLLYFCTGSPSTVDLKFKRLYNTRAFLTIYLIYNILTLHFFISICNS